MNNLIISKNGRLLEKKSKYNEDLDKVVYTTKDITKLAPKYLFEECTIASDATLKDIFLILNKNLDIFDTIIGNWTKELVTEGLNNTATPYTGKYNPDGIEYLELYKASEYNKSCKEFYSHTDLHGIGFKLKADKLFSWGEVEWKKGTRINWSLSFLKPNEIINIPIKLNTTLTVINGDINHGKYHDKLAEYQGVTYTLGEILYSIMWELSFFGGPSSRDSKKGELDVITKEIKSKKN